MKEKMNKKDIEALISYRLQRSDETIKEAEFLYKGGFFNTSVNRLYYACFYAVSALLLKNGISAQTHAGVKTMLGLHFISTKKLDLKAGVTYSTLFEKRQSGDYDDFVYFDSKSTKELMIQTKDFLDQIKVLISK